MKDITDILAEFLAIMREYILEYYQKSYSYLKDLITYKKLDLDKKIDTKREKDLISDIKKMLKAIKTGLNTIGVSLDKLNQKERDFMDLIPKYTNQFQEYNSYFQLYLKNYVNKILFEIIIDFLLNIDTKKLENVNLFDLLPPYFISKIEEFKKQYFISSDIIKAFQDQNLDDYINFIDLTMKVEASSGLDILKRLREAKQDIIETLKTPKKELVKSLKTDLEKTSISEVIIPPVKLTEKEEKDLFIEENSGTFLDYFGKFSPIHTDLITRIKVRKLDLINLKKLGQDYFDLEVLYYYVSILKMLNFKFPFNNTEILKIVNDFTNGKIFSSSKDDLPDSRNTFYGLALFSELNLLNQTNLIDLQEIEKFLKSELNNFIPEKLEFNLFTILCLKLMATIHNIQFNKKLILESLKRTNLVNIDNFKPCLDIYSHLALLKLLDKNLDFKKFESIYINEIKKLITSNGSIQDLITESAKALLIFDLLNLNKQKSEICNKILNYVLDATDFFNTENLDEDFNWQKDKLGFKIELEILYWTLLASSQYFPIKT